MNVAKGMYVSGDSGFTKLMTDLLGLIVLSGPLFFLLAYLVIALVGSLIAARVGAKHGKKHWGWYTALVFTFIMAWDLPLVLGGRWYHCTYQAGLTIHKTPEQWKQANPGVAETLRPHKVPDEYLVETKKSGQITFKHYRLADGMEITARFFPNGKADWTWFKRPDGSRGSWLNHRFIWEVFRGRQVWPGIEREEERISDSLSGDVLAQSFDFSSLPPLIKKVRRSWNPLNPQYLKYWLGHKTCPRRQLFDPKWMIDGDSIRTMKEKFRYISGDTP